MKTIPTLKPILVTMLLMFVSILPLMAQDVTVSGTVTDENSEPLIGVLVKVKNSANGVSTDFDGNYTIKTTADGVLEFSYVGYLTNEEKVNGRTTIDVMLMPDSKSLDEVVVIGYGVQKKADLTGSVAVVDMDDARKMPQTDVASMLQGMAPGVTVSTSSQPGAIAKVQIRGTGSFSNVGPLYVIDGLIVNDANNLNPNEIENMQVLKDASAAAIYGARGANGVILITTKKGKAGKPTLDVTANFSVNQMPKKLKMRNAEDFMYYNEQAYINSLADWPAAAVPVGSMLADTDWQAATYQNGFTQDYNLVYTQGTENVHMAIAGGYINQTGVIEGPKYDRFTVRFNSDANYGILTLGENFTYQHTDAEDTIGGSFWDSIITPSVIPVYDPNEPTGRGGFGYGNVYFPTYITNPVGVQVRNKNHSVNDRIIGNVYAELAIFKFLTYRFNIGLDSWWGRSKRFDQGYTLRMGSGETRWNDKLNDIRDHRASLIIENTLTYKQQFGKHDLGALFGYTTEKVDWNYLENEAYNQQAEGLVQIDLAGEYNNMWGSNQERRMISYLGRLDYNYDGRYYVQVNFRSDGSSKFGPEKRRGNFPSFSLGWRPTEEPFMADRPEWVSNLKLRGSWGKIGDMQALGNYDYIPSIDHSGPYEGFNAVFGPTGTETLYAGATQNRRVNVMLGWETKTTTNIGIDFGFFNNRLYGTIEWFNSISDDLLCNLPTAWATGTDNIWTNYGKMRNRGFEFNVGWRDQVGDFGYSISANISTVDNKVLKLGDAFVEGGAANRTEVGRSIAEFYCIPFDGIFQSMDEVFAHTTTLEDGTVAIVQPTAQPGDVRYIDSNQDGLIDDNDRVFCGSPLPKFEGSLNFTATYKGFDLNLFFTGKYGNKIYNQVRKAAMNFTVDNLPADATPWTWDNMSLDTPRMYANSTLNNLGHCDRFLEDGSFLRLKNISLGYTLPEEVTKKFYVKNLRVYVSAQNLFTITKYKGYDPDITCNVYDQGNDWGQFPNARQYSAGLQISF